MSCWKVMPERQEGGLGSYVLQNPGHCLQERVVRYWLQQKRLVLAIQLIRELHLTRMPGHPDYWNSGVPLAQLTTQLRAPHAGHDHIGDHQVNGTTNLLQLSERLPTFTRAQNLVALCLEDPGDHHPYGVLVVHHENPTARFCARRRRRSGWDLWHRLGCQRQQNCDRGPPADSTLQENSTATLRDDPLHCGQSQACAVSHVLRGVEWL